MSDEQFALDEEDLELEQAEQSPDPSFLAKLEDLKKRCLSAKIGFSIDTNPLGETYGRIDFPNGNSKRPIIVSSESRATSLLGVAFEDYSHVEGFEALCSYKNGTIEAAIRAIGASGMLLSRLLGKQPTYLTKLDDEIIIAPEEIGPDAPLIKIGEPSPEYVTLNRGPGRRFTLKLSGLKISRNTIAAEYLTTYADSLFFQFEMLFGSTFILERERRRVPFRTTRKTDSPSVQYPRARYEHSAMSLYWYAKTARGMPLLQYLAYYQVLEFFYPRFSQIEARKRLATVLKDPTFRIDRDDHVDRVISAIAVNRSGGLGDERSQLRAVVNQCVTATELREFLSATPERESHFSGKSKNQRYHKIPIASQTADLRNDAADRIYDIRCKVVHTKNDAREGQLEMILPFSEEADLLSLDIDLVNFIARSALIATSASLK